MFSGPGQDEVVCGFDSLDDQKREIFYHVLWKVNGEYLYEDTNETDQRLPSSLANSIKDGTRVSFLFPSDIQRQ